MVQCPDYEMPTYLPFDYKPSNKDILCGRGKLYSKHAGNIRYAEAINESLQQYKNAPKRVSKSAVVSSLVHRLRDDGHRFIRFDKKKGQWYELRAETIHEKTGHAIRDLLEQRQASASGMSRTTMRKRKRFHASKSSPVFSSISTDSLRRSLSLPQMSTFAEKVTSTNIIDEVLGLTISFEVNSDELQHFESDPTPLYSTEAFAKPIFSDPLLSAELLNVLSDDDSYDDKQHNKSLIDSMDHKTINHGLSLQNAHILQTQPEPTPLASDTTFPLKFAAASDIECEEMAIVLAALRRGSF